MVASDKVGAEAGSQTWGLERTWRTHTRQQLKLEGSSFTFCQIWKTPHSGLKQHIWEYLIWWLWGPLTMMKLEFLKLGFWSQTRMKSINGAKIPGFKWESCHQLLLNQWQRQDLIDNMNHILSTNAKIVPRSEIFVVLVFWAILTQHEKQGKTSANLYYTNIWSKSGLEY